MKFISTLALALILTLGFTSCSEGPAGPVGPAGQQGNPGPAGPGATVVDFSVPFNTMQGPTASGYYFRSLVLQNANIGPLDAVVMYRRAQSSPSSFIYSAMPYDEYYTAGTQTLSNNFSFDVLSTNGVTVYVRRSDGGLPMAGTEVLNFRALVIRGTSGKKAAIPSRLSYEEALKFAEAK